MDDDGSWGIDLDKAKEFWRNLDSVLPEEVGSVLTPMDINKISFEKSNTGDTSTIADAQQNIFTAAGVSSLLFNNEKASANALLLSIKADQEITYGIVKSIQDVVISKGEMPDWFRNGVEAALKAPTAVNQQKFAFGMKNGEPAVKVKGVGVHTKVDLGIVAYHFEAGSGRKIAVL